MEVRSFLSGIYKVFSCLWCTTGTSKKKKEGGEVTVKGRCTATNKKRKKKYY